jgi:GntR family transcriptional regulator / MocR family aminotransferase
MMIWRSTLSQEISTPLHVQIRHRIKLAVQSGDLLPGQQLPGVRSLAEMLEVNRLTVLKAIKSLSRAGLLVSVPGKGVFVARQPRGLELADQAAPEIEGPFFEGVAEGPDLSEPDDSAFKDPLRATVDDGLAKNIVSFAAGFPPDAAIPTDTIRIRLSKLLRDEQGPKRLGYISTEGDPTLRLELRTLLVKRGLKLRPDDRILITAGAQQGISLCLDSFLSSGNTLAMESPGYLGAIAACRLKKIPMTPIPVDHAGLNPERLQSAIRRHDIGAVYLVPNFQNPTGVTQSLRRRRQILELASRHNLLVIEDDIYADLRFGGRGIAPLKSLPGGERVVYIGSFSKSLAPGLRLGFIVASGRLADDLRRYKEIVDISTGALVQALGADLLSSGYYLRHLRKIRRMYRKRRDAMLLALETYLPKTVRFTRPKGGLHLWVMLDRPIDALKLLERTKKSGLSFSPGTLFFCDGRRSSSFRLNYSSYPPEVINQGIRLLAKCIAKEEK